MQQIALDIGLPTVPTLAGFWPGSNADVLSHLRLWAESASISTRAPVPTYLWGESGSGKTHLLMAVQEALHSQGSRCGFLGAADRNPPEFDERWDCVLMDDVQLYDAEQQHAAFAWFVNALTPSDARPRWVVAAGTLPPADLRLREDLRTRLGWGHVFHVQVPNEDERRAVLRQAADARGLFLGDEVMDFMLSRFSRDLGSLMELLEKLDQYALRTQRALTIPLVRAMLESE